ncbi:unnamed protein product [Urochloa humidicola]
MSQSKIMTVVVAVTVFLAALAVVAASKPGVSADELLAFCSEECAKEHKDPAESKQCADFCVFSSKYLIKAFAKVKAPKMRVGKFRELCTKGCGKEYKNPAIVTKCVDYCNDGAKELADAFAKEKIV